MKPAYVCSIGLLALLLTAAAPTPKIPTMKLIQTEHTIMPAYRGIATDILGIRLGMPAAQADAIATKTYGKTSTPDYPLLFFGDNGDSLNTQAYVDHNLFENCTSNKCDTLALNFTSPVTGNVLYHAFRKIDFDKSAEKIFPPINVITESLIKKYGPPSYQHDYAPHTNQHKSPYGQLLIAWVFSKDSRIICKSYDCVGAKNRHGDSMDDSSLMWSSENFPKYTANYFEKLCGTSDSSPAVLKILATIDASENNSSKAREITISMWDPKICATDAEQLTIQIHKDIIKYNKLMNKPPPGPKL